jgi:hypothetical protein
MNGQSSLKYIIVVALAIGSILGIGGSMVEVGSTMQRLFWEISSLGLIAGLILYARSPQVSGDVFVSSGFVIVAIAEAIMSSGTALGEQGAQASFGAGMALYVPGLIIVACSAYFALWVRIAGTLSAIAFAIAAFGIFSGEVVLAASTFPSAGYALLTVANIGWIVALFRNKVTARTNGMPMPIKKEARIRVN